MRELFRTKERIVLIILVFAFAVGLAIIIVKSVFVPEPTPKEYRFELDGEGEGGDGVKTPVQFVVQVEGCVEEPGIYRIDPGCRVEDAIEVAGGVTEEGDPECLNLVMFVVDGMRIYVPEAGSPRDRPQDYVDIGIQEGEDLTYSSYLVDFEGKIDINSAGVEELTRLPGIGEGLAGEIVKYREECGNFVRVRDIMKVSGIGEVTFKRIEPYIEVGE